MSHPDALSEDCLSCGEVGVIELCPRSLRECEHHCNHTWTHDACCWCGWQVPDDDEPDGGVREPLTPSGPLGGLAASVDPPERAHDRPSGP